MQKNIKPKYIEKQLSVISYQLSVNAKEYKTQIHLKALFFSVFAVSLPLLLFLIFSFLLSTFYVPLYFTLSTFYVPLYFTLPTSHFYALKARILVILSLDGFMFSSLPKRQLKAESGKRKAGTKDKTIF